MGLPPEVIGRETQYNKHRLYSIIVLFVFLSFIRIIIIIKYRKLYINTMTLGYSYTFSPTVAYISVGTFLITSSNISNYRLLRQYFHTNFGDNYFLSDRGKFWQSRAKCPMPLQLKHREVRGYRGERKRL